MAEPELSEEEYWVLLVYFESHGFLEPHDILDIQYRLVQLSFHETDAVLRSLIKKNVLSLSPNNKQVRITDYGAELYRATKRAQVEWKAQRIIRVPALDRDVVVIRAGERFKANRVLIAISNRILKWTTWTGSGSCSNGSAC